jgi:hypothetical protein
MILAHIFGIPLEEVLSSWAGTGAGAGMLLLIASTIVCRALERK